MRLKKTKKINTRRIHKVKRAFWTKSHIFSTIGLFLFVAICSIFFYQTLRNSQVKASSISTFVTRIGTTLYANNATFRFAGANMHWLGLRDDNTYPSQTDIDNGFASAQAMNTTVVRAHTLGISVGCPLCIEPTLNSFNDTAFASIDYAIKVAHDHGIRLIIPLTDNWHYYHGGKHTFTDWENDTSEDDFFTNPTVIADFKTYIAHVLNHVNQYTQVALKDDPTIMAWETGNELNTQNVS